MPISLRLPLKVEQQIVEYGVRQGLTKSAVIVRSIGTFLVVHAQPNAYQLYLDAMQEARPASQRQRAAGESQSHKLAIQKAGRKKHAQRSARAAQALKARPAKPVTSWSTAR